MRDEEDHEEYDKRVKKWTRKSLDIVERCTTYFEASKAKSPGFTFTDLVDFKGEKNKSNRITISGASSRRIRIKEQVLSNYLYSSAEPKVLHSPEAFLEEAMKQRRVDKWIREHAIIYHKSEYGLHKWTAPRIWMATAVLHVTNGEIHFESSTSSRAGGGAGGDACPAIGTPSGALETKFGGAHEKTNRITTDFGHKNERIWAAQFMPVSIEFGPREDSELGLKHSNSLPRQSPNFDLRTCQIWEWRVFGKAAPSE